MVAALTRVFGIHNLALAEDVVQDAFCRALEVWKFRGVPENPSAWLMATAKHRAIDVLRRERTARTFAPELGRLLESEWTLVPLVEELFGPLAVKDDLLRMMFSCCNPRLAEEAQVALVLHILCGFGDQRGRRGVSRHGGRHPEAHLARQKGPGGFQATIRSGGRRLSAPTVRGASRLVPAVQRGLPRRIRGICDAGRTVSRSDPAGDTTARTSGHRDAGDLRPGRADVAPRGTAAGASERSRPATNALRSGSIALGSRTHRGRSAPAGAVGNGP